jgi:hypothetical protein
MAAHFATVGSQSFLALSEAERFGPSGLIAALAVETRWRATAKLGRILIAFSLNI